jgi:hypothetical protein
MEAVIGSYDMRKQILHFIIILAIGFSSVASANLLDFDDQDNLGVALNLEKHIKWDGKGGGHLYAGNYNKDDSIYFSEETYVNSFEMNGLPWENGPATNVSSIEIEAYDTGNSLIWNSIVDLTSSKTWQDWITVPVEMAAVSSLKFLAPQSLSLNYKFWPSIDNLIINEPVNTDISFLTQATVNPVPVPGAVWLFGSAIGLLGWIRRPRN